MILETHSDYIRFHGKILKATSLIAPHLSRYRSISISIANNTSNLAPALSVTNTFSGVLPDSYNPGHRGIRFVYGVSISFWSSQLLDFVNRPLLGGERSLTQVEEVSPITSYPGLGTSRSVGCLKNRSFYGVSYMLSHLRGFYHNRCFCHLKAQQLVYRTFLSSY